MDSIVIEEALCKGCGLCVHNCPKKTIVINNKINSKGYYVAEFINSGLCNSCALCAIMCPDLAIKVYK